MIIVINSQGGLVSRQVEDIYQGSNNVNVINVVAPFASNVVLKAMFEMPDGTYKPKNGDGYILTPSIEIIEGLNTWRLDVDFPITQYSGLVKMQLRAILGSEILATSTIKFPVQQGVPYESEHIEEGTYDYLLALINDLKGLINDKVDIKHYKYSLVENINEDSVGVYYIIDPDTGKYAPKILPEEYEDETHYYEIIAESYVSNTNDGLFLEFKDNIAEQSMRLEITASDITINGKPVVFEEDLISENIKYDNANSGMSATDVKQAIDELKFGLNAIETTQVVSLGDKTILASDWVADGGLWKYEFRNEVFGDSLVQELIMTPNNEAIENLNNNDILIYPQVYQYQESEKVAVGVIKASKKPDFDMVFDIKIQGISINTSSEGVRASQIVFTASESIPKTNVQEAVMQVQTNLDTLRVQYEIEKKDFATLDNNGKIPSSQLPSYVDDVVECYTIDGVAPMTSGWLSETPGGVALLPLSGKIYVVVSDNEYQNKQYRWSGSVYAIISESLALGETSSTAYSGAKGKANADAIADIVNGTIVVNKAKNVIANIEKSTLDSLKASLEQGNITQSDYNNTVNELYKNATYSGFTQSPSNNVLQVGDEIISKKILLAKYETPLEVETGGAIYESEMKVGDVFEIHFYISSPNFLSKVMRIVNTSNTSLCANREFITEEYYYGFHIKTNLTNDKRTIHYAYYTASENEQKAYIQKIYKIIE